MGFSIRLVFGFPQTHPPPLYIYIYISISVFHIILLAKTQSLITIYFQIQFGLETENNFQKNLGSAGSRGEAEILLGVWGAAEI